MNAPIRRVAVSVMVLFALLFINLNYVQFIKAGAYRTDPRNPRTLIQDFNRKRGQIVNADGQAIASVQQTSGKLKYLRTYPAGPLYAAVTGYDSVSYGKTGLEADQDPILSGDSDQLFVRRLSDLVTGRQPQGGNVIVTVKQKVQQAAFDGLAAQSQFRGAVVALDPRTGAILAETSSPSFDPNQLSTHDSASEKSAFTRLNSDETNSPLLNKALKESYPPGSTFKTIVSAAALANGFNPQTKVPAGLQYVAPGTSTPIKNDDGTACTGDPTTLLDALRVSCNTAYAHLGVTLGTDKIRKQANAFGFDADISNDSIHAAQSKLGAIVDQPSLAQSSIGQRDVRMTPLQGAMIAGAVANNGTEMKPYLVSDVQGPDLLSLGKTSPSQYGQPMTPAVAQQLQQMMQSVVSDGTGKKAQISGVTVGGKTGTAQNGDGKQDTVWFIGYAIDGGKPVAAVAVVLDQAGGSSSVPTAIGGKVLQAAVEAARQ
ncbi:D,D-transpeptidase PbpA [Fodinicola feengrottensis]|uniref:D,D-transpeptidase PbpA n=1 Tax=Fodinicola feengrottensis TaxID=435914 RepID=A0ABN2GWX1_9ACTN